MFRLEEGTHGDLKFCNILFSLPRPLNSWEKGQNISVLSKSPLRDSSGLCSDTQGVKRTPPSFPIYQAIPSPSCYYGTPFDCPESEKPSLSTFLFNPYMNLTSHHFPVQQATVLFLVGTSFPIGRSIY